MADTNYRIVYRDDSGRAIIICPAAKEHRTVKEIAEKDVPTGYKYKIVPVTDISSDRSFRNAWTVDESDLTDGVGGTDGIKEENRLH